ncbi:MAG: xylulokinase [Planctomycetia bacterium]|nr:xylulokinase [Planctomycetia bacterium]
MGTYLGIDIGTSGTKTIAIDEKGEILASASAEYPCSVPRPLWSEQDPEEWWKAVVKTVHSVLDQIGEHGPEVRAIGLSGQMHGSVFLDEKDRVLRPAILWNDQRTGEECRQIEEMAGGRENLIQMAANPALTGFTAPKILWLRNHEPENFDKMKKVLLPKDEIRRRLTGEYATDVSDASGMLLLDIRKRNWSKKLLSLLDLDESLLGKVYESEEITGQLTQEAADLLGLSSRCLVVGGAGDCAAGAVGNGIVRPGILSTSIGTSGVMFVHSDEVKIDPLGRVHTFCHAVRNKWHLMGVNLSSGGSLQWFKNSLCPELLREAREKSAEIYDLLAEEAEKTPPGAEGLFFLPYLSGERTPLADPDARGAFIGLTLAHHRGHLVRALMEGVIYSMRESLEIFRSENIPVNEIRVSGGGSKSPLWRQMQADIFAQDVHRINSEEGPALGVALLAAVGTGEFTSIEEACAAAISLRDTISPQSENSDFYNRAFPVYQNFYHQLKDSFQKIKNFNLERLISD